MNHSSEPVVEDRGDTACIIGAGPGGLSAARALKAKGISYDHVERHADVGGIWDIANPGTPMYDSAHFISSRDLSGFVGFPMPRHLPDYPSHRQILAYLNTFADAYGLRDRIRFRTEVTQLEKDAQGRWIITLSDGTRCRYRWVVLATGTNWQPNVPSWPGHFDGELRHSITFKSGDEFRGKRVLVIGAGNSGADIACEAAVHAAKARISMRRGYHFIPKHVFGMPADVFGESGPRLPLWLSRPIFKRLLRLINGDLTRWGLPAPDHQLFESHPILNAQLLHHLQHGNIEVRPDIKRFEGGEVEFTDGSREAFDLVLCATGYNFGSPFAADYLEWEGRRASLYMAMFSRTHATLCAIGYLDQNSSAFKLFDTQALTLASYMRAQLDESPSAERFQALIRNDKPDLSGGIRFVRSDRHSVYYDAHAFTAYLSRLRRRMGWGELDEKLYDSLRKSAETPSMQTRGATASRGAAVHG